MMIYDDDIYGVFLHSEWVAVSFDLRVLLAAVVGPLRRTTALRIDEEESNRAL